MRLFQILLTVGFAVLTQAMRMSTEFETHALGEFEIKDFMVYNVVSTEFRDHSARLTNRNISFIFADPNANTTTKCEDGWTKSATVDNTPFNYIYCGAGPGGNGFSAFKFNTYDGPGKFELSITHSFSDPTHYPPPYNYVQYFAPATFELDCSKVRNDISSGSTSRCVRPGPIRGIIDRITN